MRTLLEKFTLLSKFAIHNSIIMDISEIIQGGGKEAEIISKVQEYEEESNSGIAFHSKENLETIVSVLELGIPIEIYEDNTEDYEFKGDR